MALNDKHYLSADEYLRDTWSLAAEVKRSGWKPDILIALWRGGAPVGVALHEFFKVFRMVGSACPAQMRELFWNRSQ